MIHLENTPVAIFHNNTIEYIHQIAPDHDKSEYKNLGVLTPATLRDTYEVNNILKKGNFFLNLSRHAL